MPVDAYRRAIERFDSEQTRFRAALHKAVGSDVRRYLGLSEVDSALQVIRRARGAAEAVEETLFNDLAAALPDESRTAAERLRDWRRTQRAVPRHASGPAMFQLYDVGDVVRHSGLSSAASEGARRTALTRLMRDVDIARGGGHPYDLTAAIGDENVPPAMRAAIDSALFEEWPQAVALARQVRDTQIDVLYGDAISRSQQAAEHSSPWRKCCVAETKSASAGQGAVAPLCSKESTASDGDAAMREWARLQAA